MDKIQFQYQEAFWLLTLIGFFTLLFFLVIRWKRNALRKIGDERIVRTLIANYSPRLFALKFVLYVVAFALGVFALANPRKPEDSAGDVRQGIDVVIALDVSRSMLAEDVAPNRLERAKLVALKLLQKMPNDRFGLVIHAANSYMQMPLTTDHGSAALFISTITPNAIAAQGTSFSKALKMAEGVFGEVEKYKVVVFISDGEDHDEETTQTVEEVARKGMVVYTVGIGTPQGARIPQPGGFKKDMNGNIVITKLVEENLQRMAEKTKGIYIYNQSTDQTVNTLINDLSKIEKKQIVNESLLNYETYYLWFALPMLLLLVIEMFVPDRKGGL